MYRLLIFGSNGDLGECIILYSILMVNVYVDLW